HEASPDTLASICAGDRGNSKGSCGVAMHVILHDSPGSQPMLFESQLNNTPNPVFVEDPAGHALPRWDYGMRNSLPTCQLVPIDLGEMPIGRFSVGLDQGESQKRSPSVQLGQ